MRSRVINPKQNGPGMFQNPSNEDGGKKAGSGSGANGPSKYLSPKGLSAAMDPSIYRALNSLKEAMKRKAIAKMRRDLKKTLEELEKINARLRKKAKEKLL